MIDTFGLRLILKSVLIQFISFLSTGHRILLIVDIAVNRLFTVLFLQHRDSSSCKQSSCKISLNATTKNPPYVSFGFQLKAMIDEKVTYFSHSKLLKFCLSLIERIVVSDFQSDEIFCSSFYCDKISKFDLLMIDVMREECDV